MPRSGGTSFIVLSVVVIAVVVMALVWLWALVALPH
jgi:hypothetical protein